MGKGKEIIKGRVGCPGVVVGVVRIVAEGDIGRMATMKKGEVWVTTRFENPLHDEYLAQSSALVTDQGNSGSHAGIASRKEGIPAVVGTIEATKRLKEGQMVVIDGKAGFEMVEDKTTGELKQKFYGAVYEYVPDQPAQPAAQLTLAERIAMMNAKVAAQQGKPIPQELLDKQKKMI